MVEHQELNCLRWRCRRGMQELDVLLMRFVDRHYAEVSAAEQAAFRELLTMPDPDIFSLLTTGTVSNDPAKCRVVCRLLEQQVP